MATERECQRRLDNRQEPEPKRMPLLEEWEILRGQIDLLDIKIRNLTLCRVAAEARCREIAVEALRRGE